MTGLFLFRLSRFLKLFVWLLVWPLVFQGNGYASPDFSSSNSAVLRSSDRQNTVPAADAEKFFSEIWIPDTFGKIEKKYAGEKSERLVILIQDAHAVPSAQQSVRRIIEHLSAAQGIGLVGLEGMTGEMDPAFFRAFPEKEILKRVFEGYVNRGELSGAVAAAVLGVQDAGFYGVEDKALYEENAGMFYRVLEARPRLDAKIKNLSGQLENLKNKFYSPGLLRLDAETRKLDDGEKGLLEVLKFLSGEDAPAGFLARNGSYPRLQAVFAELSQNPEDRVVSADAEIKTLCATVEKFLETRGEKRGFYEKKQAYRIEQITPGAFARYLKEIGQGLEKGVRITPALEKLIAQDELLTRMKGTEFFEELNAYVRALKARFVRNENERYLDRLSEMLDRAGKLVRLEMSRSQSNGLKAAAAEKSPVDGLAPSILSLDGSLNEFLGSADLEPAREFYRLSEARDRAFIDNLEKIMRQKGQAVSILITGGFHTEGLEALLKEKGDSFILVSPRLDADQRPAAYQDLMQGRVSWSGYFEVKDGRIDLADAFNRATARKLMETLNAAHPGQGPAAGRLLRLWKNEIIRRRRGLGDTARTVRYLRLVDEGSVSLLEPSQVKQMESEWRVRAGQWISHLSGAVKGRGLLNAPYPALGSKTTLVPWVSIPHGSVPARWIQNAAGALPVAALREPGAARSELRYAKLPTWAEVNIPELNDVTVISRQFEAGLHRGILSAIRKKYGKEVSRYVAQLTMTGGLGALMHDLVDAWKKEGADIISINPLYVESIKGQKYIKGLPEDIRTGRKKLGDYLRDVLTPTDIYFGVNLTMSDEFREKAKRSGSKAQTIIGKKLFASVYKTETTFSQAPLYYLDVYYLDHEGNKVSIFDEVYPDDKLWRDVHMAVYGVASEWLAKVLQDRGLIKKKVFYVDNEVYVSLPTPLFPKAFHHDINHTVYLPGLYQPDSASYRMMRFAQDLRAEIVDAKEKIHVTDAGAMDASLVTGVAIAEHTAVLGGNLFAGHLHKLWAYNEGGVRNTNGVLLDQWQSGERRSLLQQYKAQLGLGAEAVDADLFAALKKNENEAKRNAFKVQNEWVAAADVAEFLVWMATEQSQPLWMNNTIWKHGERTHMAVLDAKAFLERFQAAVRAAVTQHGSLNESAWQELGQHFGVLKEVLLEMPITSNVRRWVPYKGPDKWLEILKELDKDESLLKDFKENAGYVVIGGREFDDKADEQFQEINRLIKKLGLKDHMATIVNYNIEEAPILFKAMAATVMLSDEFLEASATSMMKALVNFGNIIGVWGGANPELFTIVEKSTGREIDIFAEKVTYKDVIEHLKNGTWEITNGWLVEYSDELSKLEGGGRVPLAQSLVQALKELQKAYRDGEKRRERQWQALASSPKVDIELGQARAHMRLWQKAIRGREAEEKFFAGLDISPQIAERVLSVRTKEGFQWRKTKYLGSQETDLVEQSQPGILEFIAGFRRLRMRGKEALWSLAYHSTEGRMHVFDHLDTFFRKAQAHRVPSLLPVIERIAALRREAKAATDVMEKVRLSLEALDFVEKVAQHMSFQIMNEYIRTDFEGVRTRTQNLLNQVRVRENLIRYLTRHPDVAEPLNTTAERIRTYALRLQGGRVLLAVNLDEFQYPPKPQRRTKKTSVTEEGPKAWTNVYGLDSIRALLGEEAVRDLAAVYQVEDRILDGTKYKKLSVWQLLDSGISMGVPFPSVQVLRLTATTERTALPPEWHVKGVGLTGGLPDILSAAVTEKFFNGEPPAKLLTELVQQVRANSEELKAVLSQVSDLSAEQARKKFGEDGIPSVMAFVAGLRPELLDRMRDWDGETCRVLDGVVNSGPSRDFFHSGDIAFHDVDRNTALVFSRSLGNGRRIFIPIHFAPKPYNESDGKVWFRVLGLGGFNQINANSQYNIFDHTLGIVYPTSHKGQDLLNHWPVGVPVVEGQKDRPGFTQHGKRFQILEFRKVGETKRSEMRIAGPAQIVNGPEWERETAASALTRLAQGKVPLRLAAVSRLRQGGQFDLFLQTLRAEAANPAYARMYAARKAFPEGAQTAVVSSPDETAALAQWIRASRAEFARLLERHLENNPTSLRFAFAVPFSENPEIQNWLKAFLETVRDLSSPSKFGGRISADVLILAHASDLAKAPGFFRDMKESGMAETLVLEDKTAGRVLNKFLSLHDNAAAFSVPDRLKRSVAGQHEARLVDLRGLFWDEAFPVAALIGFKLAQENGLGAELLEKLPQDFPAGTVGYNGTRLEIYQAARDIALQISAQQLISSMA